VTCTDTGALPQVLADQRDNTRHRSDDELKDLIAKTASLVLADALTSGGDFRLAVTKWTRVAARESATEAAETVAKREAVLTAQKIAHNLWRIERQRLREQEPACRRCRDLEIKMKNMINTKIHAMNVQMEALLTRAKIAAVDAATSRVKEEGPFAMVSSQFRLSVRQGLWLIFFIRTRVSMP